jgi:DNA-binding LacI/PurR family transcriptional regulator
MEWGMTRVSIRDVALDAGVSETTVSHALSGKRPVSEATLARVREASERLGYRPSHVARSLRGRTTRTTALIVPDLCNPFYPALARGLQQALVERGYQTFVCDVDSRADLEEAFLEEALARQVDGIVIVPLMESLPQVLLADRTTPVVCAAPLGEVIESAWQHPNADTVSTDDEGGMRRATEYVISKGHSRIGYLTAPMNIGPAQRRFDGFRNALAAAGCELDDDLVVTTAFTRDGGARGVAKLLDAREPPTAVLCANDLMAIGALGVALERRMVVPEAIAIVGYDDIDSASLVTPRLTTVQNPMRDIGKACGDLLLGRMTGEYTGGPREVRLPSRLVERESA